MLEAPIYLAGAPGSALRQGMPGIAPAILSGKNCSAEPLFSRYAPAR